MIRKYGGYFRVVEVRVIGVRIMGNWGYSQCYWRDGLGNIFDCI